MASKKFSEFAASGAWASSWQLVGYDPGEAVLGNANKRVPYSFFTDTFALKATFDAHAADTDLHTTSAQSAALDASAAPSGVNPYLTESGGDARYHSKATQDATDGAQDTATGLNTTHRTGAGNGATAHVSAGDRTGWDAKVESVVAGTGISVDNTDPQNPVVTNTGGSGSLAKDREVLGGVSGAIGWNYSNGASGVTATLTGDGTISAPTNMPALTSGQYQDFLISVSQDATGGHALAWDSAWINPPTMPTDANATIDVAGVYTDAGALVLGVEVSRQ